VVRDNVVFPEGFGRLRYFEYDSDLVGELQFEVGNNREVDDANVGAVKSDVLSPDEIRVAFVV
jgi:hypothetical protein